METFAEEYSRGYPFTYVNNINNNNNSNNNSNNINNKIFFYKVNSSVLRNSDC